MTARRGVSLAAGVATASVALALLAGGVSLDSAHAAKRPRPNVLVVMSDDQTADSMRYMDVVNSRIGGRGATFPRSFTNWPLCCPSRATFLTGQYAVNHDVRGNSGPNGGYKRFRELYRTNHLGVWLRDAGYYTGHVGKYLNGYPLRTNQDEHPFGWNEWYGAGPDAQRVYDYLLEENGDPFTYGTAAEDFKGDVLTGKAVDFIERRAPRRQPFFLFVGYTAPHSGANPSAQPPADCSQPTNSAQPAPRHASAFDSEPLPQPPSYNEADPADDDKPQGVQNLPTLNDGDHVEIRRNYRCRIESLLHMDEGVGELLNALGDAGEIGRTLVIYTSDNGFFHGEHKIKTGKNRPYEEAIRAPLLMRGPRIPKGVVVRDLAVNADLAPTIVDIANARAHLTRDGRSLLPAARRPSVERGRELLIEKGAISDEDPDDPNSFVGVRNRRYLYVEYGQPFNGTVELYDLNADPYQLDSRHADPAYNTVEAALARRLDRLRNCHGRSCRRRPDLTLKLSFERGREDGRVCARRPVRARVKGPDAGGVANVRFEVNGDPVASDDSAPFRVRLPHSKLNERTRSKVRAVVDMVDGRRLTLDQTVRACG